jgi:TonB family protein
LLDLRKKKIAFLLSIIVHGFVIVFFVIKNLSVKPTTSMTVVDIVENIPIKKLADLNKNLKINDNKLDESYENKENSNLIKLKHEDLSKYNQTENIISEKQKISEKKIKTSPSPKKQVLNNIENQTRSKHKENRFSNKRLPTNPTSEITKSSAKYKIGTIKNPHPEYPMIARKKGWQGRLLLNVRVSENGDVISVNVLKTSGFEILDKTSIETIKIWKFTPARIGGKNVEDYLNIPVSFKLVN